MRQSAFSFSGARFTQILTYRHHFRNHGGKAMCDIFFLDYHRSERVPTSNILPRIPKWVVQEEAQAKCCALYGIQPVGSIFSNHHKKKQQLLMTYRYCCLQGRKNVVTRSTRISDGGAH